MLTINIDNKNLTKKYSPEELRTKFISFLEKELWEDKIDIYAVSIQDIPLPVKSAYDTIDTMKFVSL